MRVYIQLLAFVLIGIFLLWFGYTLFSNQMEKMRLQKGDRSKKPGKKSRPGDPMVCPICSSKMEKGDLVKTLAFPSITGGRDRLMHIHGCMYCIDGRTERRCPVCGKLISGDDILVARMFHRPFRRPHVHVLGCSLCRPFKVM
jgi:hypothetical protein